MLDIIALVVFIYRTTHQIFPISSTPPDEGPVTLHLNDLLTVDSKMQNPTTSLTM